MPRGIIGGSVAGFRTPAPPFAGPGDVVSGATSWWGLRAYSNATMGANAVRIRRVSDNAEQDFVTLSTGALDTASIATFLAATSGKVVTLYDQTGGAFHATQGTAANQPAYNPTGNGSLPSVDFTSSAPHQLNGPSAFTIVTQATWSAVAKSVNTAAQHTIFDISAGSNQNMGFRTAADNTVYVFGGTHLIAAATDGVFHALQGVMNIASSDMNVDGSATAGNSGTGVGAGTFGIGGRGFSEPLNGSYCEGGYWPAVFTGTQSSDMSANQHSYWGF